jgi:hypothetical protein
MDLMWILPPLIASFSWLFRHWVPIIVTPSFIAAVILIYRKGALGMGNARWEADKCLKREKETEAAWEADKKRSDEREAYLTDRVAKLQERLGELDSLVDFLQKRQIEEAQRLMNPPSPTTPTMTNLPSESKPPVPPPTPSTKKQ